MKNILCLALALAMLAACNDSPSSPDVDPAKGDGPEAAQQDEVSQQKLTIEQAAEEATKLIEADAKAEMEAAAAADAEPGR
jgi:uncharacterized lipoprotein YajG